ncbi:rho GTPase-activating protein 22-like isoform X2 [Erpetoichthys calabaricus]|uniref:rho GTPase-activating protein 22-like isoform X2 n=1 Tax=Erpetoichthys calabaricus TaxID=27687 RepID=UPI00223405A6|nr:rho GTPase-activating protein 22-like isoform X2 [Erpetoichthys calabaricus]
MGLRCSKAKKRHTRRLKGSTGDKDRAAINHEAFLLMANSQNDMEDWVKAIRRVIWAPFGGGIFGQRLEDTVQFEKKFGQRLAPLLVEQCVDFIRERGLNEEGLFRMPGQANLVKELQDAFDCGDKPLFDSNTDVHTVASLLKLYLRELPEPVIPFAKYEDFLSCAQLLAKDEEEGIRELIKQVKNLPQANYNLLKYICKFLDEVQAHSSENKMSVQNLATVFGPNILRPKLEDPVTIMEGTSLVQHLMTVLIREHERLYISTEMEASFSQQDIKPFVQRSTVEWISEEDLQGDSSKNGKPNQTDDLCSSATSLDVNVSTPMTVSKLATQGKSEKQSHAVTSPSKQMKSLPTWKYSFRTSGGRSSSVKLGGSSVDITNLSSSGNWLMNGLSSLRGHRRTSSGERVKDSGSSQRLSTYDNVTASSLSVQSVPSTTWSTSSCEISIPDSTSSCPVCNASDCSGLNGGKAEWTMHDSQAQSDMKLSELGDSSERIEACVSSINCSEHSNRVTASSDSTSCAKALTILVKDLKDELGRQKVEYELRIKRLEESSAEMCAQVNRLEEELDQERKKYAMLEIKLRNSDRAREDAEKRNQLLQKEMEEFFSTLGDLTLGSRTTKI